MSTKKNLTVVALVALLSVPAFNTGHMAHLSIPKFSDNLITTVHADSAFGNDHQPYHSFTLKKPLTAINMYVPSNTNEPLYKAEKSAGTHTFPAGDNITATNSGMGALWVGVHDSHFGNGENDIYDTVDTPSRTYKGGDFSNVPAVRNGKELEKEYGISNTPSEHHTNSVNTSTTNSKNTPTSSSNDSNTISSNNNGNSADSTPTTSSDNGGNVTPTSYTNNTGKNNFNGSNTNPVNTSNSKLGNVNGTNSLSTTNSNGKLPQTNETNNANKAMALGASALIASAGFMALSFSSKHKYLESVDLASNTDTVSASNVKGNHNDTHKYSNKSSYDMIMGDTFNDLSKSLKNL